MKYGKSQGKSSQKLLIIILPARKVMTIFELVDGRIIYDIVTRSLIDIFDFENSLE